MSARTSAGFVSSTPSLGVTTMLLMRGVLVRGCDEGRGKRRRFHPPPPIYEQREPSEPRMATKKFATARTSSGDNSLRVSGLTDPRDCLRRERVESSHGHG